jgi:hypothetical protein
MGFVIYFAFLMIFGALYACSYSDFWLGVIFLYLAGGIGMFFSWLFPESP